jgi:replicative DNA helicase
MTLAPVPVEHARVDPIASPEAESAVLKAAFDNADSAATAASVLTSEDFANATRRVMFEALQEARKRRVPLEFVAVVQLMKDLGTLELIGGPNEVGRYIQSGTRSTPANLEHYMRVLKSKTLRRRLESASETMHSLSRDESLTDEAVVSAAESALNGAARVVNLEKGTPIGVSAQRVLERIHKPFEKVPHIETGVQLLDDALGGGMRGGWNVVVLAAPGHGKTAFAIGNGAAVACEDGYWALVGTQEMTPDEVAGRCMAHVSGVPPSVQNLGAEKIDSRSLASLGAAAETVNEWKMRTLSGVTVNQLRLEAERMKAEFGEPDRGGLGVVVLDYLQITPVQLARKSANRTDELEYLSRSMKALARDLEVIVYTLSQPTADASRSGQVRATDGKGAQAIQADADAMIIPFRNDKGDARMRLAKFRHGKFPVWWGERYIGFDSNRIRFTGSRV